MNDKTGVTLWENLLASHNLAENTTRCMVSIRVGMKRACESSQKVLTRSLRGFSTTKKEIIGGNQLNATELKNAARSLFTHLHPPSHMCVFFAPQSNERTAETFCWRLLAAVMGLFVECRGNALISVSVRKNGTGINSLTLAVVKVCAAVDRRWWKGSVQAKTSNKS